MNILKIYTELATANSDKILVIDEFLNLGPKTTVKELSDMWLKLNHAQEWTILVLDPLDFLDSLTAKSRDTMQRHHHGNFRSWQNDKMQDFCDKLYQTKNTLLLIEGVRKPSELPPFWKCADRTVMVKNPNTNGSVSLT